MLRAFRKSIITSTCTLKQHRLLSSTLPATMPSSKGEPTDPQMREEIKEEVKQEEKGSHSTTCSFCVSVAAGLLR